MYFFFFFFEENNYPEFQTVFSLYLNMQNKTNDNI